MFCVNCGKEIHAGASFCPECGAKQQSTMVVSAEKNDHNTAGQPAANAQYNTMTIIGLIVSGISLLLNFWGIVGIAGMILSVLGMIDCTRKGEKGKGLAIVGIAIGVYSIIYGVIAILAMV